MLAPWKKSYDQTRYHIKKQTHHFADKGPSSQVMVFPVVMYGCELDHKEGWVLKNWCFQTVVLEKTPESPLDSKEIKPVNPKGNQPWILIGRTDTEAEASVLLPVDAKSWLIGKYPGAGKDWLQEEKMVTEDEMVGRHHWLNEHNFEQTLGDIEGERSLACFNPWGCKVRRDLVTEQQQFALW